MTNKTLATEIAFTHAARCYRVRAAGKVAVRRVRQALTTAARSTGYDLAAALASSAARASGIELVSAAILLPAPASVAS